MEPTEKNNRQACVTAYLTYLAKCPKGFVFIDQGEQAMNNLCPQASAKPCVASGKQAELVALFEPYKQCQKCPLGLLGRTQVVFGVGNPNSPLMFVGEGPGRDEDKLGQPFVGRAGQLLTKIIEAMGFTRDDVYISNVVKCRPPSNRVPLPDESDTCKNL
ncbi:MAG: uracil-DNA glycosylase, partial [Candidatus Babeliales bacterium]